jgi:hypothetical protein
MLVVDFMHEFELGVWRTLFTHMMRVLRAASSAQSQLIAELDKRYEPITIIPNSLLMCWSASRFRMVPTFGHGTIRKFSNNVSEMKKLAARDFEDILQVSFIADGV